MFGLGLLAVLTQAPLDLWYLWLLIIPTLIASLRRHRNTKHAIMGMFFFAFGYWIGGTSWIYNSIHVFGNINSTLAILATLLFCAFMAALWLIPMLPWLIWGRRNDFLTLLAFPSCWFLGEWSREWVLGGFPWLVAGSGAINSVLANYAPAIGAIGVSMLIITMAVLIFICIDKFSLQNLTICLSVVLTIFIMGWQLKYIPWTHPVGKPLNVRLVQPNIKQSLKWNSIEANRITQELITLSSSSQNIDLLVWPEASIPFLYRTQNSFFSDLNAATDSNNIGLIAGVPTTAPDENGDTQVFNSAVAFGDATGHYNKQHLVPFGEYIPLSKQLSPLLKIFNLPVGSQTPGSENQAPLTVKGMPLAVEICYDAVYPVSAARDARNGYAIINLTNDTWFGDTLGPLQHFEISKWRAIETRRPMVRSTNDGISAFVNQYGKVIDQAPRFEATFLVGDIQPRRGVTPFMKYFNLPLVLLSFSMLALAALTVGFQRRSIRS